MICQRCKNEIGDGEETVVPSAGLAYHFYSGDCLKAEREAIARLLEELAGKIRTRGIDG